MALTADYNGLTVGISQDFALVILSSMIMVIQVAAIGYAVLPRRLRIFNKALFASDAAAEFREAHKKAFGRDLAKEFNEGYPDMGTGRFSEMLSYKDWYQFNCDQRTHHNYLELLPLYLVLMVSSGFFFPRLAAGAGLGMIVLRGLYTGGYKFKGPGGRVWPRNFMVLPQLAWLLSAVYGCLRMYGLIGPLGSFP